MQSPWLFSGSPFSLPLSLSDQKLEIEGVMSALFLLLVRPLLARSTE